MADQQPPQDPAGAVRRLGKALPEYGPVPVAFPPVQDSGPPTMVDGPTAAGPYPDYPTQSPQPPQPFAPGPEPRAWYTKKRLLIPALVAAAAVLVSAVLIFAAILGSPAGPGVKSPAGPIRSGGHVDRQRSPKPTPTPVQRPTQSPRPSPTKDPAVRIGQAAETQGWTFTVTRLKCGVKRVGDKYLTEKAQGQFCLLSMKAENTGMRSATVLAARQKVVDAEGREYTASPKASLLQDPQSALLVEQVNPGNTASGVLVFDMAKGVRPTKALLAGGLLGFTDSVAVDLR